VIVDLNDEGAAQKGAELGAPHTSAGVNTVSPGFVNTPPTELVTPAPGVLEDYLENTPIGRAGEAKDVADVVLYLCSGTSNGWPRHEPRR
jgi:NAD(P)-dependent dehydrogenase (short-subunit alcohol dehydrogenase family)